MPGRAGFFVLAILWIGTTIAGWREIRRGRRLEHARWMVRSYAFALSAVHFRVAQTALYLLGVFGDDAYVAAIWISAIASAMQGEVLAAQIVRFGRVRSLLVGRGFDATDRDPGVSGLRPVRRLPV